jgi:L-xylulose reductase
MSRASGVTATFGRMADFQGRRVLVTGASGGIGAATVRLLTARGAQVIAAASAADHLTSIVAETGVSPLAFDLTSEDSIRDAAWY